MKPPCGSQARGCTVEAIAAPVREWPVARVRSHRGNRIRHSQRTFDANLRGWNLRVRARSAPTHRTGVHPPQWYAQAPRSSSPQVPHG
ncbi:hypothetical protein [Nostoc sp.]|uniref:hypothetical protein n=1 Tax=Nostoc sp. TaxID=1180 RepID=UPI002FF8D8C8